MTKEYFLTSEQWERVYNLSKKVNRDMDDMVDEIYDLYDFYDSMDQLIDDYEKEELEAVGEDEESSMKLELVKQIADEKRTCTLYTIGAYKVDVTIYEDKTKRISVNKDYKEEFLPEIYFKDKRWGNEVEEFQIQTTAYGALNPSDIQKIIKGYEEAMKVAAVLTEEFLTEKAVELEENIEMNTLKY